MLQYTHVIIIKLIFRVIANLRFRKGAFEYIYPRGPDAVNACRESSIVRIRAQQRHIGWASSPFCGQEQYG